MDRRGRRPRRATLALTAIVVLLAGGCQTQAAPGSDPEQGSTDPTSAPSDSESASSSSEDVELTFAVFGPKPETASFERVVEAYNAQTVATDVRLVTYDDRAAMLDSLGTPEAPDLFLASRSDLDKIVAAGANAPLLELLDERGVDYGDGYSRDALLSFSIEDDLQCMPYGISPTVVYYNADLIDFESMAERSLAVPPTSLRAWSLEAFTAAANEATRPRLRTRGVHVEPSLRGLAPFVYSGAGQLFDDEEEPTSLDLESDAAQDALTETLALLRDPLLTLSGRQLSRATPLEWFERGKLGMITGTRALTPRLREVEGLNFDVMPLPVLEDQVSTGDMTGLCISSGSENRARTADFLVRLISNAAVADVAESGYLVPANLEVALTDDFLQPLEMPRNANIFNLSVRDLVVEDLLDPGSPLSEAVNPSVRDLFTAPVLDDLQQRSEVIDTISRSVLDPDYLPDSELPSELPAESELPSELDGELADSGG